MFIVFKFRPFYNNIYLAYMNEMTIYSFLKLQLRIFTSVEKFSIRIHSSVSRSSEI